MKSKAAVGSVQQIGGLSEGFHLYLEDHPTARKWLDPTMVSSATNSRGATDSIRVPKSSPCSRCSRCTGPSSLSRPEDFVLCWRHFAVHFLPQCLSDATGSGSLSARLGVSPRDFYDLVSPYKVDLFNSIDIPTTIYLLVG